MKFFFGTILNLVYKQFFLIICEKIAKFIQGAQWFSNGWPQISGVPAAAYAAAAGTTATTGNWGDWYNNAANAANFYASNGSTATANFPTYAGIFLYFIDKFCIKNKIRNRLIYIFKISLKNVNF